jgi:hypothetical protein
MKDYRGALVDYNKAIELVLGVNITLPQIGKKKKEGKRI